MLKERDEKRIRDLKKIPPTRCAKCKSAKSYGNPMAKCFECKKKFCYDHILGGQYHSKRMSENHELRDICDSCKDSFGYISLEDIKLFPQGYKEIKN